MKKKLKEIKKEYVWLGFIALGPITAFLSVYYPALSILAIIFIIIGIRGVLGDVM